MNLKHNWEYIKEFWNDNDIDLSTTDEILSRQLYAISSDLPCRLINRDNVPYLERYFVKKDGDTTVYLHRFVDCDGDKEVHNHPWDAATFCLVGSYEEEVVTHLCVTEGWKYNLKTFSKCCYNPIKCNHFHRIRKTERNTWTLFIHGKIQQDWGFLHHTPPSDGKNGMVTLHQPFELTKGREWWLNTPLGKDSQREPY